MKVRGKGKGLNVTFPKCDAMTGIMLVLVFDVFYAIVHDISKSGIMHGFHPNYFC